MTPYVLGFGFHKFTDDVYVSLIRKNKPEWQKGKRNGVGGKVELNEHPQNAMVREFKEETGVDTKKDDWKLFCQYYDDINFYVYCYYSFLNDLTTTITDEPVTIHSVNKLPDNVIPNIRWLVPMALSFSKGEKAEQFIIKECIKS